jgi:hypothetical protein
MQKRKRRIAICLLWDAPSVGRRYVMYAGKRGTISISNCKAVTVVIHKVYNVDLKMNIDIVVP